MHRWSPKTLARTLKIDDPLYRAQALSFIVRYTEGVPPKVERELQRALSECADDYLKTTILSWYIAALSEKVEKKKVEKYLSQAIESTKSTNPASSRAEALLLLIFAVWNLGEKHVINVFGLMVKTCPEEEHWRCKRALKRAQQMMDGKYSPRSFFHED